MSSETLYESKELQKEARDAAALLASKVYYFLGEYDDALSFALGAGQAFEAESRLAESEEYIETVVCGYYSYYASILAHNELPSAKAIDKYVELRSGEGSSKSKVDTRLQGIIEGILRRCINDGEHKQVRWSSTVMRFATHQRALP